MSSNDWIMVGAGFGVAAILATIIPTWVWAVLGTLILFLVILILVRRQPHA